MSVTLVNIGLVVNDGTGDPLRTAFNLINANFTNEVINMDGSNFAGKVDNDLLVWDAGTSKFINITIAALGLALDSDLTAHISDAANPHNVSAAQVELGSVGNYAALALDGSTTMTGVIDTSNGNFTSSRVPTTSEAAFDFVSNQSIKNSNNRYFSVLDSAGTGLSIENSGIDLLIRPEGYTSIFDGMIFEIDGIIGDIGFRNTAGGETIGFSPGINSFTTSSATQMIFAASSGAVGLFFAKTTGLVPGTGSGNHDLGEPAGDAWRHLYLQGNVDTSAGTFISNVADGASAIGFDFDTSNDLSTSGAYIATFSSNNVRKCAINKDGSIVVGDNVVLAMGSGVDSLIYYDGTDLIVNPKFVGSGVLNIRGSIRVETYERHVEISVGSAASGSTAPTPTTIGTARTLVFSADAEQSFIPLEVPSDWDGISDLKLEVHWCPVTAMANTETVKWDIAYRTKAVGEAISTGTATTATATYTQSGAGTAEERIDTSIILPYDDANNPIAVGDTILVQFNRDMSGDTFGGDAAIFIWGVELNSTTIPKG